MIYFYLIKGEIDHYEVKRGVQSQDNKVVYTERYRNIFEINKFIRGGGGVLFQSKIKI